MCVHVHVWDVSSMQIRFRVGVRVRMPRSCDMFPNYFLYFYFYFSIKIDLHFNILWLSFHQKELL